MIQLAIAAFSIGILGSFHCVGMCGPLALSLPLNNNSTWSKFSGALLYNAGRIATYSFFGLIFGAIGKTVALFGFQQWLSVILGALIIVFVLLPKRIKTWQNQHHGIRLFEKVRSMLGRLFLQKNHASLFLIGLLNGLLPCGLVYMAVAGAVAAASITESVLFMAFFGLGTLPVMWSVAFLGNYVSLGIRQKIRRAYPYMMMGMACLLILRGMGLGIPYVSPKMKAEKAQAIECCAKP
ncbi:MAG TPA: sulfite exporter TauE/SafE family protein [Ferruginibacter sp.]|nr:sulfite exporter TauE/SafE family protein [Ferruginibacter sp.]